MLIAGNVIGGVLDGRWRQYYGRWRRLGGRRSVGGNVLCTDVDGGAGGYVFVRVVSGGGFCWWVERHVVLSGCFVGVDQTSRARAPQGQSSRARQLLRARAPEPELQSQGQSS